MHLDLGPLFMRACIFYVSTYVKQNKSSNYTCNAPWSGAQTDRCLCVYVCVYIYICIYVYMYVHTHTFLCVCVCVCVCVCMCVCVCISIYMYTYVCRRPGGHARNPTPVIEMWGAGGGAQWMRAKRVLVRSQK